MPSFPVGEDCFHQLRWWLTHQEFSLMKPVALGLFATIIARRSRNSSDCYHHVRSSSCGSIHASSFASFPYLGGFRLSIRVNYPHLRIPDKSSSLLPIRLGWQISLHARLGRGVWSNPHRPRVTSLVRPHMFRRQTYACAQYPGLSGKTPAAVLPPEALPDARSMYGKPFFHSTSGAQPVSSREIRGTLFG